MGWSIQGGRRAHGGVQGGQLGEVALLHQTQQSFYVLTADIFLPLHTG